MQYGRNAKLIHIVAPATPGVSICGPKLKLPVSADAVRDIDVCTLCMVIQKEADKIGDSDLTRVDAAGIVSRLKAAAQGAANKGSSEMAAKQATATDHSATLEQIAANIERAASLAEADNLSGLAELERETEALISSLPTRGKIGDKTATQAKKEFRADFKTAATLAPKPEPKPVKAEVVKLSTEDYHTAEGVAELVTQGAQLFAEGVRTHIKFSNMATDIARILLSMRVRMTDKTGVPDVKATSKGAREASSNMYAEAGRLFLADSELSEDEAKKHVAKLQKSVQNAMPTVRAEYLAELDSNATEAARFELITGSEQSKGQTVSEAVAEHYGVPLMSRYELEKSRNADTDGDTDSDESDAEGEGASEAATPADQVGAFFAKAESNIERAKKVVAKAKDDETARDSFKARIDTMIAELATLKAGL
jgi:hypothetical protein